MPGPNVYTTPAKDRYQAPYWSVPKGERFRVGSAKQPGPGEYEYVDFTAAGPKYTTRVKPPIDPFKMKTKPGPGHYSPEKPKKSIFYSMGAKVGASQKFVSPGPGSYEDEHALHYKTLPGSKIGKDQRKSNTFLHTPSYNK